MIHSSAPELPAEDPPQSWGSCYVLDVHSLLMMTNLKVYIELLIVEVTKDLTQ